MKIFTPRTKIVERRPVVIEAGGVVLEGDLELPPRVRGVVMFAHGSGSSRLSPRNRYVARVLREAGLGTLLFDLLDDEEGREDAVTRGLRFSIAMLAQRLEAATAWLEVQPECAGLRIGYFGSSTGGAAALLAAAQLGAGVGAVVVRGGRPDLVAPVLSKVRSPTLLIVGGCDQTVVALNEDAFERLCCEKELRVVPGATHLFAEPGALEQVARLSADWFNKHLGANS